MIRYSVKHGIVCVTETQLDYIEAIVPANMRYNTAEAGACIIDMGNSCFESGEKMQDWLNDVIATALSNSVQFLHFVVEEKNRQAAARALAMKAITTKTTRRVEK